MLRREFLGVAGAGLSLSQIDGATESLSPLDQFALKYFKEIDNYVNCRRSDERLLRPIEEHLDIPEQGADDFRRSVMAHIGSLYLEGKPLRWNSLVILNGPENPNEIGDAIKKEFEATHE